MNIELYTEKPKYSLQNTKLLGEEAIDAIGRVIEYNAVGSITGYYDESLTILSVSDYLLNNLNYSHEQFEKVTGGSLKKFIYGDNFFNKSAEWFRNTTGVIEARVLTGDGTPVFVNFHKIDSVDVNGTPIWVMAGRVVWEQENLDLINEALQSGPWYMDCDKNGNIVSVHWSQNFRKMLGYNNRDDFPDELESWSGLLHPEDKKKTLDCLFGAIADITNQTKYRVKYRLLLCDGKYHWFHAIGEISRRLDGSARHISGIFINIDKEQEMIKNTQKADAFHNAFTNGNLCEYYVDLEENTFDSLKVKPFLTKIFENSDTWDELIQSFIDNYVCQEDKEPVKHFYNRVYIARTLAAIDTEIALECRINLEGSTHWIRNIIMHGEEGNSRYVLIFLRDVTESKAEIEKRNEELKKNEDREHLIRSMSKLVDHFAVCNLSQNSYHYINVNIDKKYEEYGKYSDFIEAVTQRFKTLEPLEPMKTLVSPSNLQNRLKSDDDIYKIEYCSNDETIYRIASFIPLEWNEGVLVKVLWTSIDITKAKKDEIEARRAITDAYHAAERANRAKTEFLSNMSHDIRTPMNAIVGMTAIAGANIDHKERVKECLSKITSSSRHLLGLINEVLDMSRIESGRVSLVEEDFNLSELIDNLVTMIKPSITEHHHDFDIYVNNICHEDVCGDSLRIQQIFVNLMSNAVKYTPDGGKIALTIEEKPDVHSGLGCYEFVIEDNGIGMTEEFQKIMFEPFTRADDQRTTKVQGTGLGMAITRNIVSMMNGNIKVESVLNQGTKVTMTIYLKLQEKDMSDIKQFENLPVLVVDDNQGSCESTVAVLKEIGFDGEYVLSGKEAIKQSYERHKNNDDYFAIIMDWDMPEMDGIEATRQIRKFIGENVTIIILTAYDYSEIEEEARKAGVNAFIVKPLFRSRLVATFRNIMSQKTPEVMSDSLEKISEDDFSDKRILLVEDNELNREIATEILKMSGVQIELAENGREACEKVISAPENWYDLILMDIQMPEMNGYEATAAIRVMEGRRKYIPIVAMTANAFAEDVQLAKNTGMNEHIAKPLDFVKLEHILKTWLKDNS